MNEQHIRVGNEDAMLALGAQLADQWSTGGIVTLHGDLGAGKTTLVRGWLQALGHAGKVKSPTYTLVEHYHLRGRDIYHFDLYRLSDPEELEYMGIRDYLRPDTLCLLEWPEKGGKLIPAADLAIRIQYHQEQRIVTINSAQILNIK